MLHCIMGIVITSICAAPGSISSPRSRIRIIGRNIQARLSSFIYQTNLNLENVGERFRVSICMLNFQKYSLAIN